MQQQHPPPPSGSSSSGAAAAVAPSGTTNTTLSFDEVAKHFSIPIAEAATTLGVCTSVLKRICRDNGIARWPYRKFLAGKTVEDIKKDAAREKSKELLELSKVARERMDLSTISHPISIVQSPTLMPGHAQEAPKFQRGVFFQGHVSSPQQPVNKPIHDERHNMLHSLHPRSIPNYEDEFRYGFPVNGLSSASIRWWGGRSYEGTESTLLEETTPEGEKKQQHDEPLLESPRQKMTDGETDGITGDAGVVLPQMPSLSLCSLRKRAVTEGYESLRLDVTRRCGLRL